MSNEVSVVVKGRDPDLLLDGLMQTQDIHQRHSCAVELLGVATQADHLLNGMIFGPTSMRAAFAKKIFSSSTRDVSPFILIAILQLLPETYEKDDSSRNKFRQFILQKFEALPLCEIALEQLALAVPGMAGWARKKLKAMQVEQKAA